MNENDSETTRLDRQNENSHASESSVAEHIPLHSADSELPVAQGALIMSLSDHLYMQVY